MSIVIKQNGTDVTTNIDITSIQEKQVLTKEVSTLVFNVKQYSGKVSFSVGDQVDRYEGSTHVFGGTVVSVEKINLGGILLTEQVSCIDWSFKLNKKLVAKNYASMDPADIVADILSNFTDGTFTTTHVTRGNFIITTIKFNYELVTAALEKLAKQIGWEWYVDPDKNLYFFPPNTVSTAPFGIDDTTGKLNWPTLDIMVDLTNMKNSIYVIGGNYTKTFDATSTPDQYTTDGVRSVFALAYPYDKATMTITLNGVSQTIGTDQVTPDGSVQVQYNDASRFIRFTSVPTTGQTVKIYGNAKIPILAHAQNNTSIGTYGEIQDSIIDKSIKSVNEAQERANAQLELYGSPVYTVKFDTLQTGLIIGQTININSTIYGTSVNVIIKEIDAKAYSPTQMIYSVTAVGTEIVSFVDVMKVLLLQANSDNQVDDSTILQLLLQIDETSTLTEVTSNPVAKSPPYVYGPSGGNIGVWNLSTWS